MNGLFSHGYRRSIVALMLFGLTACATAQPPVTPVPIPPGTNSWSSDSASVVQDTLLDSTCVDSCYPDACCCCVPCPKWSILAGAVLLSRSGPGDDPLFQDATEPLFGSDFDLGWQAGYELEIRRHDVTDERDAIAARLFVVDGWSAQASALIPGATQINTSPAIPMVGPRAVTSDLSSELLSFELNYIWQSAWHPAIRWLVGLRTLEIDETMSSRLVYPPTGFPTVYHSVGTQNRLYGAQLGTEIDFFDGRRWALQGIFSAGVYGNAARHQSSAWDDVTLPVFANDRDGTASFVGETGLAAKYVLTPGIALRANYRVLWASGLALAPEQVALTNFTLGSGMDNDATAFYHGLFFGVDWTF